MHQISEEISVSQHCGAKNIKLMPELSVEGAKIEHSMRGEPRSVSILNLAVVVAALGYFVDIYDLVLFSIVRIPSLRSLNVPEADLLTQGVYLLNMQMAGMLLGGIAWGVLGDKRGRVSVLFGSIFLYSIANIANAYVTSIEMYALLRLLAGIGLAGELGAAVTIVSEIMPKESRGYGTALVAGIGVSGAVLAAIIGRTLPWQTAYTIGGILGLLLLFARVSMIESHLFTNLRSYDVSRGNFFMLFSSKKRLLRYMRCIIIGIPIWFVVGILMTFAPEICKALGAAGEVSAASAIMACYIGLIAGDLCSGFLSQMVQSRKKVLVLFLSILAVLVALFLHSPSGMSPQYYYVLAAILGFAAGYWAVFVTTAAEQFGTNIRATVTTTVPNFVRGAVVLLTLALQAMKGSIGLVPSASVVGLVSIALAFIALTGFEDSYDRDLNFVEKY